MCSSDLVGGDLSISGNELVDLGLDGLTEVGGYLYVIDSAELTNISLPSLTSVGGTVTIRDNQVLAGLGLSGLSWFGGNLEVHDNPALPYCEICPLIDQLTEFDGDIQCHDNLEDECWNGSLLCPGAPDVDTDTDSDSESDTYACEPGFTGASCDVCVRYVDASSTAEEPDGLRWHRAFPRVDDGIEAGRVA